MALGTGSWVFSSPCPWQLLRFSKLSFQELVRHPLVSVCVIDGSPDLLPLPLYLLGTCLITESCPTLFVCVCVQLFLTPQAAAHQASLSFAISWSLLKLMSIESVTPSNHLIICCPLLLLPSIFPSIRVFSSESVLHIRWSKHWSFSFSINPSNEYSGLISFSINWLDLLAGQGTLKSLLQGPKTFHFPSLNQPQATPIAYPETQS